MTAKLVKSTSPANDDRLLSAKVVDLTLDEDMQFKQARRILGESASVAKVTAEAAKRIERAREIDSQLVKPLGTSTRPFPMWGTQRVDHEDGNSSLRQVLSVIADDTHPLKVYSERPYKEVMALAYCDMPVPSMLQLFFDGLERRKPESTNRTQMMIGDPGAGKSFLGSLQGRMRSKKSVEVFDCGGKNMNDLLFEMVLDFGKGDILPHAIDKKLQAGTMHSLSLALIEQFNTLGEEKIVSKTADGKFVIDWTALSTGNTEKITKAHDLLTRISHIEQLEGGGNALGMNSQHGALVRAFLEGREIVLDEYNKSKEGSDNALQTVWQFMIGEINTCTVENPLKNKDLSAGPSSFTFRREDMQAGFFVTLTGNKTEDGLTTRSLNKSVYSRLSPQTLPDPTVADWQHRICQMMVGMPVSTLYYTFRDQADANPKEFGEWLLNLRKAKAEIEGVPVPELQEALLQNWTSVVGSSEQLAKLFSDWADMTNAERLLTSGNTDLIEEVDEEYSKKEGMDFRKIKQILEVAIPVRPRMLPEDSAVRVDFTNFDKAPVLVAKEQESAGSSFGTRLVEYIERMIFEKSEAVGKHELYKKLQASMDSAGLRDVHLREGAHSGKKSVEKYLNVSVYDSSDLGKQALAARKVFCDYLRELDSEIKADDEQIITVARLKKALAAVAEVNSAETKQLFVVNHDHETLVSHPLTAARIDDMAERALNEGGEEPEIHLSDIISHGDFLASLALPTVGEKNLEAIWDGNIRKLVGDDDGKEDPALDIAENRSSIGLATTTLRVLFTDVKGETSDVPVHIIRRADGKTLVVSEAAPQKLQRAFKEAGITHIDRQATGAKAEIERELKQMTNGMKAEVKGFLRDAFGYRHVIQDIEPTANPLTDLSAYLADRKVEGNFAKFVLKGGKKLAV